MVVVIIVGILAGIGMGHYQRNWKEERLKAIARETAAWLEDARLRAIQQSKLALSRLMMQHHLEELHHLTMGMIALIFHTRS